MFETSVVRAQVKAADRRVGLLTLSVAAHAIVITAVIATSVANVSLPHRAPNQVMYPVIMPTITIPPPLGNGGPKKTPAAAPPAQQKRAAAVPSLVTPNVIPDKVESVTSVSSVDTGPISNVPVGTGGNDDGPGVLNGVRGSIGDVPLAPPQPQRIYTVNDGIKLPVVINRVIPPYPVAAQRIKLNGWVTVQCTIDQSGHVREAHVVKSSFGAFEQPALDAVQQWVFRPGTLNGQPVDVIFELNVKFQIN
jgi:protein TonB